MKNIKKFILVILGVMMGLVPLIVHMRVFFPGLDIFDWFYEGEILQADFFLYYKALLINIFAVVLLCLVIVDMMYNKRWQQKSLKGLIPAGILAFLVLLSGLLSKYRHFAFKGVMESFESVFSILSYLVFFACAYIYADNEDDIKTVLKAALPGLLIMSVLSLLQIFSMDFFRSSAGKHMIVAKEYIDSAESLSFAFGDHVVYATLYSSNYVPQYFVFMFFIALALGAAAGGKRRNIMYAVAGLAFIIIIFSGSKTGIASVLLVFVAFFLFESSFFEKIKFRIPMFCIALFLLTAVLMLYDSKRTTELDREYALKDIETNDDEIVFHMAGDELHLKYEITELDGVRYDITDSNGNNIGKAVSALEAVVEEGTFAGSSFGYTLGPGNMDQCIEAKIDKVSYIFKKDDNGACRYVNNAGRLVKMRHIDNAGFFRNSFLSGRGNIWNHSIPLLKNRLLLGSGAGTFGLIYPQDDYIYKSYNSSVDYYDFKAHNMYLQLFLENGLPALLVFLYLIFAPLFVRLKKKDRTDRPPIGPLQKGIIYGLAAYLILALTNDSNLCTAPIFWTLLGLSQGLQFVGK